MVPTKTQINSTCNRCKLHEHCHPKSIGLRGYNSTDKKPLVVFTDGPDYFADHAHRAYSLDTRRMLDWLFARMSVDTSQVAYEYTTRCYAGKEFPTTKAGRAEVIEACSAYRFATITKLQPKAIVVLGQVSFEAFTGAGKVGENEGRTHVPWEGVIRDFVPHVWAGYSIVYILVSPGDTSRVFRVLYRAAEEAGLSPRINPSVPVFKWRNLLK